MFNSDSDAIDAYSQQTSLQILSSQTHEERALWVEQINRPWCDVMMSTFWLYIYIGYNTNLSLLFSLGQSNMMSHNFGFYDVES